jgi:hypothetical protein
MDVVGHETPAEHPHAGLVPLVLYEMQIRLPILMREKDIGAIDASLGYVIGDVGEDTSWISRHTQWCRSPSEILFKLCQTALTLFR